MKLSEAYRRMKNDPKWIRANRDGKDDKGTPYKKGDEILYFPLDKSVFVGKAADYEWSEFMKSAVDEGVDELRKEKAELLKLADILAKRKKQLYGGADPETPKSAEEKKLDKEVADLYSRINTLVAGIRKGTIKEVNEEFIGLAVVKKNARAKDLDSGEQEPVFTHTILPIYRKEGGAYIVKSNLSGNALKIQSGNLVIKMKKDIDPDKWNKIIAKYK